MNSFWNKNLEAFKNRFPQLYTKFSKEISVNLEYFKSKNNAQNALDTSFSPPIPLHSKYNPQAEAQSALKDFNEKTQKAAVYFSFGLGWGPLEFCRKFSSSTLILIENNTEYFFSALNALDWQEIFCHKNLILLLGDCANEAANLIYKFASATENFNESTSKLSDLVSNKNICFIKNQNQAKHQENFIKEIQNLLFKTEQKNLVNTNTLEKFSYLWMKNSSRNLTYLKKLDGVNKYFSLAKNLPFIIIASGPSLSKILPSLAELKKRAVLVCVDSALHSVLKAGVEPDFIVITDPQYYCYLHLEFLKSETSVLIAESAVYPSVFKFECKEKVLCASMFPIAQYFESKLEDKGRLGAGGSVSTTAWDFARKCGAKKIFIAGMDIGFPNFQTHIKGAQAEENAHRLSTRFSTVQNQNVSSLITANPEWKNDYNKNPLLSDKKMSLFSWWFENAVEEALAEGIQTFTLTSESLEIKGIKKFEVNELLCEKEVLCEKEDFFRNAQKFSEEHLKIKIENEKKFDKIYEEFLLNLKKLKNHSEKAINLCTAALKNPEKLKNINEELSQLDQEILTSSAKDAAALVFPTKRRLNALYEKLPQEKQNPLSYSKIIYEELLKSTNLLLENLQGQNSSF